MNEKIFDMAKIAATALSDKKGQDIKVIKVAEKTTLADYLVICGRVRIPSQRSGLCGTAQRGSARRGLDPSRF